MKDDNTEVLAIMAEGKIEDFPFRYTVGPNDTLNVVTTMAGWARILEILGSEGADLRGLDAEDNAFLAQFVQGFQVIAEAVMLSSSCQHRPEVLN